ncbi:hypothetical protein BHL83_11795 [Limosilactobacillus reuteri]|uniref:Uncharacterized protein n=1 Tax=Limosilactobacillus reuteri TaxID=1598 RepID=A0AAE5MRY5_LIMRT|nr:hypothetical protein BHL83_11795 [Limosilactobacillus reuteri]
MRARPFDEARGSDFINTNSVPLFSVSNMDDLQAMIYYGVTLMLFKDADDLFGHAQNFLTNYQSNNLMSVYPSLTEGTGTGKYSNGTTFTYKLQNVDMHFIWAGQNQAGPNQPSDDNTTGWRISSDGNHYVYYQNGQPLSGRQYIKLPTINGTGTNWYLVDNGVVQSQWGDWYLFGSDGRILTGVQKWAGTYYYFDPVTYLRVDNNYVRSQWGDWYMFGPDGRIVTGLYNWMGSLYYFDPVTYLKVVNQYVYVNGIRYWANANGQLSLA